VIAAIRLDPEATVELSEAVQYYEARAFGLGRRYLQAAETTLQQITRMPRRERSCHALRLN
jgi:hypothetical protein